MSTATIDRQKLPWFRRLYLPTYRVTEAARYAGTHATTVASWHYRGEPVLPGRAQHKPLTYLELVEVAFVAFFRQQGIPMRHIRNARHYVATNFGKEHPLAEYQFMTEGMHILMDYNQFDYDPNMERVVVADSFGQLAWSEMMGTVFAGFEYDYDLALRWHPAGQESLVVIDPRVSFGAPVVEGLPTWVIKGRKEAGESIEEIIRDFGITKKAIQDALRFERRGEAA